MTEQVAPEPQNISVFETDLELHGDLSFSKELHIKGRVNGNIASSLDSSGKLILHNSSTVNGEIRAPYILISGMITGNVFATRRLTLTETAVINGDIHYGELEMTQGANINGLLVSMGSNNK